MTASANPDLSFGDIPRIVVRHKGKAILFFVSTLAVVLAFILWGPRRYGSEAKLYVGIGHESVTLDPTATIGQTVSMQVTRQQEINSVTEILGSRTLAEKVVEAVTPQAVLSSGEQNWLLDAKRGFASQLRDFMTRLSPDAGKPGTQDGREDADEYEEAIEYVQSMLDISAGRDSYVITVGCRAQSPQLAQQVVKSLVDAYVYEHTRFNRTAGSDEFFEEQSEFMRLRLMETEQDLRDLKNKKGIVTIDGQLDMLETHELEIKGEQLTVSRELASTEASVASLLKTIETLDKTVLVLSEKGHDNEAADIMRSQLYDLELREGQLSAKFTKDYPSVREIREQLPVMRNVLEKENESRTHDQFGINPNWQELQLELLQNKTKLASLRKTSDALATQRAGLLEEIRELNHDALNIKDLQRQVDLADKSYTTYSGNLEQARIDAALAQMRITNVNVVQDAALVRKPISPKKPVVAGLGLLVAAIGAIGIAMAAEHRDGRLKNLAEVEATLALPVLVAVPRSSRQRVHV